MGQADQRQEDPVEQIDHEIHRDLASQKQKEGLIMARSIWKGPFVDGYLLKKADASRSSGRSEIIKIWSRRSTILPQFVGLTFGVYNGHKHVPVNVTEEMIGHKFGEFSPTRTFHGHTADKKARRG
jgi:small subunit ribosomal protein S19